MEKRKMFNPEDAFKTIVNAGGEMIEEGKGKGRPKSTRETKKQISLALYPSVYSDLQKIAYVKRKSVSGIINELAAKYVCESDDALKEYISIKKKENKD